MADGRLEVTGTIDVTQFWPTGSADADTTKILVTVGANAFRFRPNDTSPFQTTHAFDNATVIGSVRKAPIDNKSRVTIRLQGIDAPELHYRPKAAIKKNKQTKKQRELYLKWNLDYRQRLAETATVRLKQLLEGIGQNPLPCTVFTHVDEPDEVFDTYGRFIGDILVTIGASQVNINTWLVEQGWAFPAYYNSMSEAEIATLNNATDVAWQNDRGVWPWFRALVGSLDWKLEFRRPSQNPTLDAVADGDTVILPKLFRRLSAWAVNKRAGMVSGTFETYLRDRRDYVVLADDFLDQGEAADLWTMDELVTNNALDVWPEDLVFREKSSRLIGPGGVDVNW